MALTYELDDGKHCTLVELIKKFPKEWEHAIRMEYRQMHGMALISIIAEATDHFEEILASNEIFVEPLNSLGDDDLNILLEPLMKYSVCI